MSLKFDLKNIENVYEYLDAVDRLKKDIRSGKFTDNIVNNINTNEWYEKCSKKKENIISSYYSNGGKMYSPTYSLQDAIRVIHGKYSVYLDSDESYITEEHRVSNSYIYEYMFVKGYHGGAHFGNGMFTPISRIGEEYNGNSQPFESGRYEWKNTTSNKESVSPYNKMDDFNNNENISNMKNYITSAFNSVVDDYIGGFR